MCMCLARAVWLERVVVYERFGFGLYQSCGNKGSVGRVSMFRLRWGVGRSLGPGSVGLG